MAITPSSLLIAARNRLWDDHAWLWFFSLPLRSGGVVRCVKNVRDVYAGGDATLWPALPVDVTLPQVGADGALGTATVRVPNVGGIAQGLVDSGGYGTVAGEEGPGEILGQVLSIWIHRVGDASVRKNGQSTLDAGAFDPALAIRVRVLEATCDALVCELSCGDPAETGRVPKGTWTREIAPQLLPSGSLAER